MNLWEYLDRKDQRKAERLALAVASGAGMRQDRVAFRYVVGIIAIAGGLGGLAGLYIAEVPGGNKEALMVALGLVLGWGSIIMNGEWGSSPAGRQAAAVGVRQPEAPGIPTGTPENPTVIEGVHGGETVTIKPEPKKT